MMISQNFNLFSFFAKYQSDIQFLQTKGELVGEWSNVLDHCLTEALVADICADLFFLTDLDREIIVRAAILHDAYKKHEVMAGFYTEKMYKSVSNDFKLFLITNHFHKNDKIEFSNEIIELTQCVGHESLSKIIEILDKKYKNSFDQLKLIMHLIDSMTAGDKFVLLSHRISLLENNIRYKELNESGRNKWQGKTHFQMMLEVGQEIIKYLSSISQSLNFSDNEKALLHTIIHSCQSKYGVTLGNTEC